MNFIRSRRCFGLVCEIAHKSCAGSQFRTPVASGWPAFVRRFDLISRGLLRLERDGRGGYEMNVVFLPALASAPGFAMTDSLLCTEVTCLFGWAWSIVALTLLSAWCARRLPSGSDLWRFAPYVLPNAAKPQAAGIAPLSRAAAVRFYAASGASWHALRAPPTTSSPSLVFSRSTGTPTAPDSPGLLG